MNHKAVCRTAPATPGLLNIEYIFLNVPGSVQFVPENVFYVPSNNFFDLGSVLLEPGSISWVQKSSSWVPGWILCVPGMVLQVSGGNSSFIIRSEWQKHEIAWHLNTGKYLSLNSNETLFFVGFDHQLSNHWKADFNLAFQWCKFESWHVYVYIY